VSAVVGQEAWRVQQSVLVQHGWRAHQRDRSSLFGERPALGSIGGVGAPSLRRWAMPNTSIERTVNRRCRLPAAHVER
jgi:hypothetical protein